MTNTNVAAETISNTIYETKPYGTPEEFNLQTIPEKIIDVEYTEVDDDLERKSANDNGINNNPTPPVTTNALIPVGNSCQSVALPVAPENLITCIEFNQSIAEATMKMVKKYGFTKSDMEQLYQRAWKHAAIVFEAQSRLGKLLDFYLEGKLPQAAYDKRQEQIEKERQELEKTAEKYKTIDTDMKQKVIDVMAMTSNISTIFERANITEKQNLLKLLITDCKMNGRKLEYKILQPFDKLIKCSEYKQWSAVAITYLDEFEKLPV